MPNQHDIDPQRDAEIFAVFDRLGSARAAGREIGIHKDTVWNAVRRHQARTLTERGAALVPGMDVREVNDQYGADGALRGFSVKQSATGDEVPLAPAVPSHAIRRISTNYRADGTIGQRWVIESPEQARRWQEIEEAIEARVSRITPALPIAMPKSHGKSNLLNSVTIADGHVGALAWPKETGSSAWDLSIARETIIGGAMWLIDNLPPAEDLLLKILGDFLDFDGFQPLTPASKHLLDVDGRFPRVADVGCEIIEAIVLHALRRYRTVRLVIKPGNHDPLSAWWMRKFFLRVFAENPRVIVEPSIRPYWAMLFGKSMIATHHGDKVSLGQLPSVFACDFAELWGQATYRICHTGHLHHKDMILHTGKELNGMMVYQHPTVASRNAWAADKGLSAAREMLGHSYKRSGGMVTTLHWTPDTVEEE